MLTITLLAACAHRATVVPATLSGGWSSGEVTVFVLVDAATASPVIWVERGEDAELSPARAVVRQGDGVVHFRPTQGPPSSATLTLSGGDSLMLTWVYDASGQAEHHPLTRTAPRSREALEQAWAERAAAQVAWNVEAIRTAELAHFYALGAFLPAGIWPRTITALTSEPVAWGDGSDFDALGWTPDGEVRGTFQVTVAEDGGDLTVHGWQDLDGDGAPAHWTATRHVAVTRISDEGDR